MILLFCQNGFTLISWFLTLINAPFMLLGVDDELQTNLVCGNQTLKNSKQEKIIWVTIDNKLNFATHLSNITKSANIKFDALTRVQKYMTKDKKKTYILFFY